MSQEKLKVPQFDGHFEHWNEIMENLLRAKNLWHLIDPGITEPAVGVAINENQRKKLEELQTKDKQVKHYLYQAIDRVTFEQILDRRTAKSIWACMKQRFEGNERVKKSMLQKLRRDFEILEMKTSETISEYFARVVTIANQMRSNGEVMPDVKIVEKILRTLTEKYIFVVVSIEESRDVEKMTIDELHSTLLVHEQKFKRPEKEEDQALKINEEEFSSSRGRGRGRSNFRGRGRGRGRSSFNKDTVECYKCHKLGHFQYECPLWKESNYAELDNEEEMMLMAIADEEEVKVFMAQTDEDKRQQVWFLDSGCSNHMCGNKDKFTNLDLNFSHTVKLGNNNRLNVTGKGNVKIELDDVAYVLQDVYYLPELKNNLLSIGQLEQKGLGFLFQSGVCKVYHQHRGLLFQSIRSANRLYPLFENNKGEASKGCLYTSDEELPRLWHERYGHISKTSMEMLQQKEMVEDLPKFKAAEDVCTDCCIGKQHRHPIPKTSTWRAKEKLELIHSDICGPISPKSNSGKRYILSFIDDYSRKAWVYVIAEKSEAFDCFKEFKKRVEVETGRVIKAFRTDRGGEFVSDAFNTFCRNHGIRRQLTTSYTPQQNGVAERKNRTVMNMVVMLLSAKNMPKMFWAEAVVWTFHVLNRCPTKALSNSTPQEAWNGSKPSVDHFRIWGCIAHVLVPKEKRTKLDDKSIKCIFVGISEESKAYRCLNPKTMKIITSKDVIFEENKQWRWDLELRKHAEIELTWEDTDTIGEEEVISEQTEEQSEPAVTEATNDNPETSVAGSREGRQRRRPSYLKDYVTGNEESTEDEVNAVFQDPVTFEEAVKNNNWRKAMDIEIEAIQRNQTWELVELPKEAKCIGVKWIYKTKLNERGEVDKHKARLVAKGYCQEFGVDYVEVYAPVARMDTIRMMIAFAAQRGWNILQMDVKSAFLHGALQEDVYVQQPQGYVVKNEKHKVYKLHKALYGLKQAPRAWFSRIESYFLSTGFKRSEYEHTLFIKRNSKGSVLIVNIYVDDLIYTGDDPKMLQEFKESMMQEFEMSDLGRMRYFLGIEVLQTEHGIHISQQKYAVELLKRFGFEECHSVANPIVPGNKLIVENGNRVDATLFRQIVGSLMYITTTRPDIQFVVNLISRYCAKPTEVHFAAAKRVLRYLKGTLEYGIWYKKGGTGELEVYTDRGGTGKLEVYTDSDFAGDVESMKSTSGYVFLWDKGAVAWASKKQDVVALSSTEAEYVAAAACACQTLWVTGVLEEFGLKFADSITIKCDNTSTIKLSKNPVFHGRCKHIGVRFHFLRDLVKDGKIVLEHCGSSEQAADIFTKPLSREVFAKLREKLGVCSVKDKLDELRQSSLREGMMEYARASII
ncbi:putative RNA-directed DNA polymerase [Helianthus annuus]|nr:putative RNA-directed DNA polymerase [Helianthus annuus]